VQWPTVVLLIGVGCAIIALGVILAADIRLATRPDPTAWMAEHGHR
jgi:hypothetical protein